MGDDSFKEKIQSLGFPRRIGQSEIQPVRNEDTGNFDGGYHKVHWDGRQDAHIVTKPVVVKLKVQEGEAE